VLGKGLSLNPRMTKKKKKEKKMGEGEKQRSDGFS
jgi:hypothetical protein